MTNVIKRTFLISYWNLLFILRKNLARMGLNKRPEFLIIGAQKAGTSSLFKYLSLHPEITPPFKKEIGYFHKNAFYNKGHLWYHRHFPLPIGNQRRTVTYESTPEYLYYPYCPNRIHAYDPQMKLLVLLRDPVDRAFSAWIMFRDIFLTKPDYLRKRSKTANAPIRKAREKLLSRDSYEPFEEIIHWELENITRISTELEPSYVRRGLYADQLKRYLKYFKRDQLLVVDSHLLRTDTQSTLDNIVRFLGLHKHDWHLEQLTEHHTGKYYGTQMANQTRDLLREFYKPHNQTLYKMLDHDFGWQ